MADLKVVYQQLAFADPVLNGMAGDWSENCEKLRGTIRKLDGYMVSAAARHSGQIPLAASPTEDS